MSAPARAEHLKLTTRFGERDRIGGQLVADRLLDLYGERRLRASILLRGAQGFGPEHRLRTDRLLTLSEDLPLVAVAVDTRERIEAALAPVAELQRRGLTTVEPVALLDDESIGAGGNRSLEAVGLGLGASEVKLTVYLGRHERVPGRPAFAAVCELLHREGVAGASALLGVDGTRHGRRRRARFFATNARVPMAIVVVGASERIVRVVPKLAALLQEPLLTLARVRVCKRDGQVFASPSDGLAGGERGPVPLVKLTVVSSEGARHDGRAVHLELIRRLRAAGAAGATSLRGVWGFHGAHAPHGDRLLSLHRHVPVLTVVIDTPQQIARLFPIVDELTGASGLVTSEPATATDVAPTSAGRL